MENSKALTKNEWRNKVAEKSQAYPIHLMNDRQINSTMDYIRMDMIREGYYIKK